MVLIVFGLLATALVISLGATAAMKRIAPRLGFVDRPGHRKIHDMPKPLGGGVAIFLAMALPMLAIVMLAGAGGLSALAGIFGDTWCAIAIHEAGIRHRTPMALWMLLAMFIIHIMGLCDDRRAMGPFIKLGIQLAVAAGLVLATDIRALTVLDGLGLGPVPSVVLTVLWIAAITNAFNFLDNMDGLSAGVAVICAAAFLAAAVSIGQLFVASMLALLLGAALGFLIFNFAPASIFMGDSGSLLIGFVLGVLTVRTTYIAGPPGDTWYAVLAPLVVLAVPLYDLLVVSAIRLARGKSPFVGDTNHFSHRLVARGMSRRTAVLCIYLVTAATSVGAVILPHVTGRYAVLIFVQTLLILGVVMVLERHPLPGESREQPPQR